MEGGEGGWIDPLHCTHLHTNSQRGILPCVREGVSVPLRPSLTECVWAHRMESTAGGDFYLDNPEECWPFVIPEFRSTMRTPLKGSNTPIIDAKPT